MSTTKEDRIRANYLEFSQSWMVLAGLYNMPVKELMIIVLGPDWREKKEVKNKEYVELKKRHKEQGITRMRLDAETENAIMERALASDYLDSLTKTV